MGAEVKRKEDPRLITGTSSYVGDLALPGMHYVAFVRSPHAHARVRRIDASAALRRPGVFKVVTGSDIRKLFINADPGIILTGAQREFCRRWPNQREITVKGSHFIQEDSPAEIGQAIAAFVRMSPA